MNKIYLKLLSLFISVFDYPNKKKVLNFFKRNLIIKKLTIIDIGAHKGETIDFFVKNFNLEKIFSFEPNFALFSELINKKDYRNKIIEINNFGVGERAEIKKLNIMRESSSSTFNHLNLDSKYYKRKNFIVNLFSQNKEMIEKKQNIEIVNLSDFIRKKKIDKIDLLKIDTEGYEFNIIKGIDKKDFDNIDFIYFEHHYDLMIKKNYKFSDINDYLNKNNFFQVFKIKMNFRNTFEYIYKNSKKKIN